MKLRKLKNVNLDVVKKSLIGGYKWFLGGSFFIGALGTYNDSYYKFFPKQDVKNNEGKNIILTEEDKEYYLKQDNDLTENDMKKAKYKQMELMIERKNKINNNEVKKKFIRKD